jgi:hypothetical protein
MLRPRRSSLLWKSLFSLWICGFASIALGQDAEFSVCGHYEVNGTIVKQGKEPVLKISSTSGETILSFDSDLGEVAQVFMDKTVTVEGRILSPVSNNRGHLQSLKTAKEAAALRAKGKAYTDRFDRNDVRERTPDPLHPEWEAGFKLVNKLPCSKKK